MESLVATAILGVLIAGMVSLWVFMFNLTIKVDNSGIAYSLGRQAIEQVKQTGFYNTSEGTTTLYYDANEGSQSAVVAGNHVYKVVTDVKSGVLADNGAPADDTLRTVTVTVYLVATNNAVYTMGTYLVRAGT
jgi:type II secretory pathway pseudopilin PulG